MSFVLSKANTNFIVFGLTRPELASMIYHTWGEHANHFVIDTVQRCIGLFIVFNSTFNNISVISWWSVFLVEETGVLKENHRPFTSHRQTLSYNVVLSTPLKGVYDCLTFNSTVNPHAEETWEIMTYNIV